MCSKLQPIATFEWKTLGAFIALYPSIYSGTELVLVGENENYEGVIVQHKCVICDLEGHHNCPYIQSAVYLYMIYRKQRFEQYKLKAKRVQLREEWEQIPIPSLIAQ